MTIEKFKEAQKLVAEIEKMEKIQEGLNVDTESNGIALIRYMSAPDLMRYDLDRSVLKNIEGIILQEVDSSIKSLKARLTNL